MNCGDVTCHVSTLSVYLGLIFAINNGDSMRLHGNLSRRQFLITAGASTLTSIVLHGCANNQIGSTTATTPNAQGGSNTSVKLGFLPVVDSAPLIIAKEKGFFAKHGAKNVEVAKQASWSALRDNIEIGSAGGGIDGIKFDPDNPQAYLQSLKIKKV